MATPEPSARLAKIHAHSLGRALGLRNVKSPRTASRSHAGDQAAKRAETSAAPAPAGALDSAALAKIIGHQDEQTGPVYKITIGRPDIDPREPGAAINARMGQYVAAFAGTDADAMVAGRRRHA